ncbi:MAG: hypothetical protein ACQEWI_19155 [Bacillota bacterium]
MNKKWLLMLTGISISAMLVGCNFDGDQEPPPPEAEQNGDQDQQQENNSTPEE